jgi:hypothetical protein
MKHFVRNSLFAISAACALPAITTHAQVLISGYMANPAGTDGNNEYVQLVAYDNVDFSLTPMSLVVANNGSATANGWSSGSSLTYKFDLTSGSVSAGQVFYVGGSGKVLNGTANTASLAGETWIRSISVATTAGDGFGNANSSGVLGNGGSNADGIAVFSGTSITSSTVPLDAIFFGTGTGSAVVSSGTAGYELPSNDLYTAGKLQSGSSIFSDPTSGGYTRLTGTFDLNTSTWGISRTASTIQNPTQISDIETSIGFTGVLVPEPSTTMLGLVGAGALALRACRRS